MSLFGTKSNTSYVQVGYSAFHETVGKFSSFNCLKMKEQLGLGYANQICMYVVVIFLQSIPNTKNVGIVQ